MTHEMIERPFVEYRSDFMIRALLSI